MTMSIDAPAPLTPDDLLAGGEIRTLSGDEERTIPHLLPEFRCKASDIFPPHALK